MIRIYYPFLIMLFLLSTFYSTAQTKVGFSAGINFSTAHIENDITNSDDTNYTQGYRLALLVDIP